MDFRLYTLSFLTFVALKISYASSEPGGAGESAIDDPSNLGDGVDELSQFYPISAEELDAFEKRRSLMRFGKRRSLMRFGKRGSIMRFGKRGSLMRFGKRDGYDSADLDSYAQADLYAYPSEFENEYPDVKRGSLLRFGKRPSIMRFGRSIQERSNKLKPHTPWRFGREEDLLV